MASNTRISIKSIAKARWFPHTKTNKLPTIHTKAKGVTLRKTGLFDAQVWCSETKRQRHVGTYLTKEEAASAHDRAVIKMYGDVPKKLNYDIDTYDEVAIKSVEFEDLISVLRSPNSGRVFGISPFLLFFVQ